MRVYFRESMMDDFEEAELLIMQDEAMRVSMLWKAISLVGQGVDIL